jgi:Skp family chaperone for outer membrane proteins
MRSILFILVFALFGMVSTMQAQSADKIGYIDLQSVIKNSKAGKAAKTSFESEFKKKRLIIENKAKILAQEEQDFINQA